MIFHRHHPHSFGMRSTHPVTRLFHDKILTYSFRPDNPHNLFHNILIAHKGQSLTETIYTHFEIQQLFNAIDLK